MPGFYADRPQLQLDLIGAKIICQGVLTAGFNTDYILT